MKIAHPKYHQRAKMVAQMVFKKYLSIVPSLQFLCEYCRYVNLRPSWYRHALRSPSLGNDISSMRCPPAWTMREEKKNWTTEANNIIECVSPWATSNTIQITYLIIYDTCDCGGLAKWFLGEMEDRWIWARSHQNTCNPICILATIPYEPRFHFNLHPSWYLTGLQSPRSC